MTRPIDYSTTFDIPNKDEIELKRLCNSTLKGEGKLLPPLSVIDEVSDSGDVTKSIAQADRLETTEDPNAVNNDNVEFVASLEN